MECPYPLNEVGPAPWLSSGTQSPASLQSLSPELYLIVKHRQGKLFWSLILQLSPNNFKIGAYLAKTTSFTKSNLFTRRASPYGNTLPGYYVSDNSLISFFSRLFLWNQS